MGVLRQLSHEVGLLEAEPLDDVQLWKVPHRDEFADTVGFVFRGPSASLLFPPDINAWRLWDKDVAIEMPAVQHVVADQQFLRFGEGPIRHIARTCSHSNRGGRGRGHQLIRLDEDSFPWPRPGARGDPPALLPGLRRYIRSRSLQLRR